MAEWQRRYGERPSNARPDYPDRQYADARYGGSAPAYGDRLGYNAESLPQAETSGGRGYGPYPGYRDTRQQRRPLRSSQLKCRDVMTRDVVTCGLNTPIRDIARIMRTEDTGAIPVLNDDRTLAGIVTDRDLVVRGLVSDKGDTELRARDVITDDVYTASPHDRVVDALREMGEEKVRRLPIVDKHDRLVGIISLADLTPLSGGDQELAEALQRISKPASWFKRLSHYLRF